MSMNCSLVNRETKQPIPFYKTNGEYFREFSDAIKSAEEGQSVEVVLLNTDSVTKAFSENDFQAKKDGDVVFFENKLKVNEPKVEKVVSRIPITFNTATKEGVINTLISQNIMSPYAENYNGKKLFTPFGIDENTQAVNAVTLKEELTAMLGVEGFIQQGNTFEILGRKEIKSTSVEGNVFLEADAKANKAPEKIKTLDTEKSLTTLLTDVISKMGVSIVSIEEYKERYKNKHGVHPDAKGLADIANSVIALQNGELIDEAVITEEVAHFIVEGMSETDALLDDVVGTSEWNKHSDRYREIYSQNISDPIEVEKAVKKEVLGKILANGIRENYSPKTSKDASVFESLWNKFLEFLNRITNNNSKEENTKRVKDYIKRVNVLLENERLADVIENQRLHDSILPPMYALSENSPYHSLTKIIEDKLRKAVSNSNRDIINNLERGVYDNMEQAISEIEKLEDGEANLESGVLANMSLLSEIANTQMTAISAELANLEEGVIVPSEVTTRMEALKQLVLDPLAQLKSQLNLDISKGKFKSAEAPMVVSNLDKIALQKSDIEGRLANSASYSKETLINKVLKDNGREGDDALKTKLKNWFDGVFKEQGWLQTYLGRASQSSNPIIKRLGAIAFDNYTKTLNYMNTKVKPVLQRLEKNSKHLKGLIDTENGVFSSHLNNNKTKQKNAQMEKVVDELVKKYVSYNKHLKDFKLTEEELEDLRDKDFSLYTFDKIMKDKLSIANEELLKALQKSEYDAIELFNDGKVAESWYKDMKTEFSFNTSDILASLGRDGYSPVERLRTRLNLFKSGINGYSLNKATFLLEQQWSQRRGDVYKRMSNEGITDYGSPAMEKYNADLQAIKKERTRAKSVFNSNGNLKVGFKEMRKGYKLQKGEFEYKVSENLSYVFDTNSKENVSEAKTAYDLYMLDENAKNVNEERKLKGEPPLFPEGDVDYLTEQLENYINDLKSQGLNDTEINKRAYRWFKRNGSIAFTEDYLEQFETLEGYDGYVNRMLEKFYRGNTSVYNSVGAYMSAISERKALIRHTISLAKSFIDYREIRPQDLSIQDINRIEQAEREIAEYKREIRTLLKEGLPKGEKLDDVNFADINMDSFFNNEFYSQFYAERNKTWENATNQERLNYLESRAVDNSYAEYTAKWNKMLKGNDSIPVDDIVRRKLGKNFILQDENFLTKEDVQYNSERIIAFSIPTYWKRTTPKEYQDLERSLSNGDVSILDVVKNKNGLGKMMEIKASYSMIEENDDVFKLGEHLYNKRIAEINNTNYSSKAEELIDRYNALLHVAGKDTLNVNSSDLNQEFLNKFGITATDNGERIVLSAPTKNLEAFESLIDVLDLNRMALKDYGELNNKNLFRLPQNRASGTQRLKQNGVKKFTEEWFNDLTTRPEDEQAQAQLRKKQGGVAENMFVVPRQGLAKIPLEDLSFDVIYTMSKFARDAKEYRHRKNTLDEAIATREAMSNLTFKNGKYYKDTNDYKAATNYINAQFLGQQPIYEAFINLPNGNRVDMAKVASRFRKFVSANNLMFAPLVAATSAVTATLNKSLARVSNYNMFGPSSTRAFGVYTKMMSGGISDMGKIISQSDIDAFGEFAGLYDMTERTKNAQYGNRRKDFFDIEKIGYSIHSFANYVISPRVMLSKLMEYRVITDSEIGVEGKLMSWSNYLESKKMNNPNLTKAEIQKQFEAKEKSSLFDMMYVENGVAKIDYTKAESLGIKTENMEEYFELIQQKVNRDVQSAISLYDGVIHQTQTTEGQRHPLLSFLHLHKAWFVIASEKMFGSGGFNMETGNFERSAFATLKDFTFNSFVKKDEITGKLKFQFNKDSYKNLTEAEKSNIGYLGANLAAIGGLLLLGSALLGFADDDEEDMTKQLLATLSLRVLGETTSATFGMPSEWYNLLESPVVPLNTIENMFKLVTFQGVNSEVTKGMYKGSNKWGNTLFKLTFLKNVYMYQDPSFVSESRKGYIHFASEGGLYSSVTFAKWLSEDEDDE